MRRMRENKDYRVARENMVLSQLKARSISDPLVLKAMLTVPRHLFVDEALESQAYNDHPLPIGDKQTISQPYMVASMTEALELSPKDIVLEIGTGCGYQTAILAEIAAKVYSIERISSLMARARKILEILGYLNVLIKVGDGTVGWRNMVHEMILRGAQLSPDEAETLVAYLAKNFGHIGRFPGKHKIGGKKQLRVLEVI